MSCPMKNETASPFDLKNRVDLENNGEINLAGFFNTIEVEKLILAWPLLIRLLMIVLCHQARFYFRLTTRIFSFGWF